MNFLKQVLMTDNYNAMKILLNKNFYCTMKAQKLNVKGIVILFISNEV
jgi:hypothetical protein